MPKPLLLFMALVMAVVANSLPAYANTDATPEIYTLSFDTPEGKPYALSRHKGEVLLINFWATWCPPCVNEMPDLDKLNSAFDDQPFSVIAISAGESAPDIAEFSRKFEPPLSLQILLDSEGRAFNEFKLKGLPMSYLFDRDGNLIEVITGAKEWAGEEWQARIKALIGSAP